jgi:nitrite reductase/ring-hydroxylating ferredoxin subunit
MPGLCQHQARAQSRLAYTFFISTLAAEADAGAVLPDHPPSNIRLKEHSMVLNNNLKTGAWWAVALSEAVGTLKPLAAVFDGQELVLFRNSEGVAVALEDRCPHRRVPLSIGHVKGGHLQCAYHGWTFNGSSGACTSIPNLGEKERVPAQYAARSFPVREAHGFVLVWLGAGAPSGELPVADYQPSGREYTGASVVSLACGDYLTAVFDGPQALLALDGVRITDFFLGDARADGDCLVLDRGAVWQGQGPEPSFVTDYPLIVRTTVALAGGAVQVQLLTAQEQPVLTLQLALGANRRGTTSLCWRGFANDTLVSRAPLRWRLARLLGRAPFQVFSEINGAALAALLVQPSQQYLEALAQAARPARVAA